MRRHLNKLIYFLPGNLVILRYRSLIISRSNEKPQWARQKIFHILPGQPIIGEQYQGKCRQHGNRIFPKPHNRRTDSQSPQRTPCHAEQKNTECCFHQAHAALISVIKLQTLDRVIPMGEPISPLKEQHPDTESQHTRP